jgi:hypothetical protein
VLPRRRRFTGLLLALLLLAMQALWLVHQFEHDSGAAAEDEAECEFCLALHGMGAALPGAERAATPVFASGHVPRFEAAARGDADPVLPRQQGPPSIS